jgi:hypothetical protein
VRRASRRSGKIGAARVPLRVEHPVVGGALPAVADGWLADAAAEADAAVSAATAGKAVTNSDKMTARARAVDRRKQRRDRRKVTGNSDPSVGR